jgi:predicted DNA-binding protein
MKERFNMRLKPEQIAYLRETAEKTGKTQTEIIETALNLHRIVNEHEEMKKALETLKSIKILK